MCSKRFSAMYIVHTVELFCGFCDCDDDEAKMKGKMKGLGAYE